MKGATAGDSRHCPHSAMRRSVALNLPSVDSTLGMELPEASFSFPRRPNEVSASSKSKTLQSSVLAFYGSFGRSRRDERRGPHDAGTLCCQSDEETPPSRVATLEDGVALFADPFNAKPSLDDKAASSRVAMQLYLHNGKLSKVLVYNRNMN